MKLILSENDYVIVPAGTVLCVASEESLGKFSRYIVTEKEFAVPASGIQGELLPSTYTNKVKMAWESANNSLERETEFMKSQMKEAHERRIQAERDKVDELNRELREFKCLENRRKRIKPMADLIKKGKLAQILAEKEKIKTNVQNLLLDPCCKYEGCEESESCCEGTCEPCNPTVEQSLLKAVENSPSIELADWQIELGNSFNVPPDVLMGLSEEQGKRILETANTLRELKKELEDAKITLSIRHLRK